MDKKIVRSLLCVLCALLLCSYSVLTPVAEALTATMSLSLAVTALAVLIISSIGVTITAPSGQDVTDYVGARFQSWVAGQGYNDIGAWFSASTGITLASYVAHVLSGALAVGKLAYDAIKSFVEYFISSQGIEAGGDPVGNISGGVTVSPINDASLSWTTSSVAHTVYSWSWVSGSAGSVGFDFAGSFASNMSLSVSALPQTSSGVRTAIVQVHYASGWANLYLRGGSLSVDTSSVTLSAAADRIRFVLGNSYTSNGQIRYAAGSASAASIDITFSTAVNASSGAVFSPDTNILDLPALSDDESYQIGSDVITGNMSTTEALAEVTNLAATSEGIKVSSAVGDTPVNPPSTGPVSGLQDVFPFCLPFDFARFVGILSATRAAPEFDWIIPIPAATGLGIGDQYIHIDLSDFDPAAEILRTAELLAAAIGLILLTRDLLKW